MNDRQTRSGEKKEVASPHRINYYCLQLYEVPGDRTTLCSGADPGYPSTYCF